MLMIVVVALAALAVGAPAALGHRDRPDPPAFSHRGPDHGLGLQHLKLQGTVVLATPAGVQVNVTQANGAAAASLAGATSLLVKVDPGTRILRVGLAAATIADLKPGDRVKVWWDAAATPAAALPAARRILDYGPPPPVRHTLRATVSGAASPTVVPVTVTRAGHRTSAALGGAIAAAIALDPATLIRKRGKDAATYADLLPGDRLRIVIEAPRGANPLGSPARRITDLGPPPPVRYAIRGTVAANAAGGGVQVGVSLANRHAQAVLGAAGSVLVRFDPATRIHKRGVRSATVADLVAGDRVRVVWWAQRGTAVGALPAARRIVDSGAPR
jgi:hypothetical protein